MRRSILALVVALSAACADQYWDFGNGAADAGSDAGDGGRGAAGSSSGGSSGSSSGVMPGDGSACGAIDTPCCAGGMCAPNAYCHRLGDAGTTICLACGGSGNPCCAGGTCMNGGCCSDGYCAAAGMMCVDIGGLCQAGSCGNCGANGQPCCQQGTCTAGNVTCQSTTNTCVPCSSGGCGGGE